MRLPYDSCWLLLHENIYFMSHGHSNAIANLTMLVFCMLQGHLDVLCLNAMFEIWVCTADSSYRYVCVLLIHAIVKFMFFIVVPSGYFRMMWMLPLSSITMSVINFMLC